MKKAIFTVIMMLFSLLLAGCDDADMEGIVLETTENDLLVATELTVEAYEEIEDQSASQIQNEDVYGDTYRGLIYLTYDQIEKFSKGDQVDIWIDGDIRESYPLGATAKKVAVKK